MICHPINQVPSRSSVLLKKITGPQLVKKFPAFYGTRKFITEFTTARHLSLSWARSIHSMPQLHFLNSYFNIILPSMLGFSKWSLSFRFPNTTLYAPLALPLSSLCFVTLWHNGYWQIYTYSYACRQTCVCKNNHQRYLHMQNRKFHISTRDLSFWRQCCWRSSSCEKDVLSSSSAWSSQTRTLLGLLYPEKESTIILRIVNNYLPVYTV